MRKKLVPITIKSIDIIISEAETDTLRWKGPVESVDKTQIPRVPRKVSTN